jgi:hypothetical protein
MTVVLSQLHHAIIRGLIDDGRCPTNVELSRKLEIDAVALERSLRELADVHGVVLHPHVCEPWIVHPFSLTPTLNWIAADGRSWWAPCLWCALGVTTIVGGTARIHTRIGAEAEPLIIDVVDGRPITAIDTWVHFAIPPARAWDNVHLHCSLVLPFHFPADIELWCQRHGVTMGEAMPLEQVALLARVWYGKHADADWTKWSTAEAAQIFTEADLTSPFWRLESGEKRF